MYHFVKPQLTAKLTDIDKHRLSLYILYIL